jgi:hypothetical protein
MTICLPLRRDELSYFYSTYHLTFSGAGNGDYRGELLRACEAITSYAKQVSISLHQVIVRLDGLYGNAAPLTDLLSQGLGVIVRGKDYALLDLESVQARLARPPDQQTTQKDDGNLSRPLRLPEYSSHRDRTSPAGDCRDASGNLHQESDWRHT